MSYQLCDYCGINFSYKTNGESKRECYNKAHTGDCNKSGLNRSQRRKQKFKKL
jgi:hypothetical protein